MAFARPYEEAREQGNLAAMTFFAKNDSLREGLCPPAFARKQAFGENSRQGARNGARDDIGHTREFHADQGFVESEFLREVNLEAETITIEQRGTSSCGS